MAFTSISEILASYPDRFRPEEADGIDGVVQLHFTGDGGGDYFMVIRDQTLEIYEGQADEATVAVTVAARDWIRLNNRETNGMTLLMMGKLKVTGSLPMATRFQGLFRPASL